MRVGGVFVLYCNLMKWHVINANEVCASSIDCKNWYHILDARGLISVHEFAEVYTTASRFLSTLCNNATRAHQRYSP